MGSLSICLEGGGGECVVLDMLNNTHSEHSHLGKENSWSAWLSSSYIGIFSHFDKYD